MTIANEPLTPVGTPSLYPEVNFPEDPRLRDLPNLFDPQWVWQAYLSRFGTPTSPPDRIRVRHFAHSLGRTAIVTYEAQWPDDAYIPSECLVAKAQREKDVEFFRYPFDPDLPGLKSVANPDAALGILNKHVFAIPAKRAKVQLIRYRPANRAVLRHVVGKARFYVRVVRPAWVPSILAAYQVIARSSFVTPRIVEKWPEGGVLWLSEIPGRNLRRSIQAGKLPDADALLDNLRSLWELPLDSVKTRPFNLYGTYRRARRSFIHNLRGNRSALRQLKASARSLDPFVRSWRPTHVAHNDFYDDQLLALPDGRVALVDFEEAGPGDPMLDVGNFLAHLRWTSRFGRESRAEGSRNFYWILRQAALSRFRWDVRELALREAVCLFRICTNAIRHPQGDWQDRLEAGLSQVNEILEGQEAI